MDLLVQQRGVVRTAVTKLCNEIDDSLAAGITVEQAQVKIAMLTARQQKLQVQDEEIQRIMSGEADAAPQRLSSEILKADEYQEKSILAISLLTGRILALNVAARNSIGVGGPSNQSVSQASGSPRSSRDHHLPKQELTTFAGDPLKWAEFWDDFEGSVHNLTDMPEVQKFKYLKKYLVGEPLSMLEGFSLTAANYNEVISLLKERYGNPQAAVFAHFEALLSIPESSHEVEKLRAAYNQAEAHIRSLVALGLTEDTFGQVFVPILLSKMPRFVRIEAHRKNGSQRWELTCLRKIIREEIEAREKAEQQFMKSKPDVKPNEQKPRLYGSFSKTRPPITTPSSAALVASDGKKSPFCAFCSGSHYSDQCRNVKDYESRQKFVKDNWLCQLCLGGSHKAANCRARKQCWYCRKESHHRSLCRQEFGKSAKRENYNIAQEDRADSFGEEECSGFPEETVSAVNAEGNGFRTVMQSAVAHTCGPKCKARVRLVFDTAASRSFITQTKAEEIGAKVIRYDVVSLGRFRENRRSSVKYPIVEVEMMNQSGQRKRIEVAVVEVITTPIQLVPICNEVLQKVRGLQLAEKPVSESVSVTVDMLVGLDWYFEFIDPAYSLRLPQGLVFMSSFFGYVAGGRSGTKEEKSNQESNMLIVESNKAENFELERFWSLEDLGVKDSPHYREEEVALQKFQESLQFANERYHVKWPFKDGAENLPTNYGLALGRLRSLLRRHQDDPTIVQNYEKTFHDQLAADIIEIAPEKPTGIEHYIPHQCVVKTTSNTTKFRVVLDASAKSASQNLSINEQFYRCPLILSDLVGIIIRFRRWKIALMGDIEKAYLQIGLQESERDCTRFLWVKDASQPVVPSNIIVYRLKRVPFGFMPSAFLLGGVIDHLLLTEGTSVALDIQGNLYVDNSFGGREEPAEAIAYVQEAISIFKKASMNLREWYSNSAKVLKAIPEKQRGAGNVTKVLGLKWDTVDDVLSCQVGFSPQASFHTKRQILKAVASVYDPCGWFAPITVQAKMILQQLWLRDIGWDEEAPDEILTMWVQCSANLLRIPSMTVCRQFQASVFEAGSSTELHCFCDASTKAYAAVVYVRVTSEKGSFTDILMSKGRISPAKKKLPVPKLELMAALIGTRLIQFVEKELRVEVVRKFLWSDSKVTLHWIRGKQKYSVFVENRVKEIRAAKDVKFRYVPTDQNPADLPSRETSADELSGSTLWWNGPKFLVVGESSWPEQGILDRQDIEWQESKDLFECVEAVAIVSQANNLLGGQAEPLLDATKFSNLRKLCRVTAYIFRLAYRSPKETHSVTAEEQDKALWFWVKHVQSSFGELMNSTLSKHSNKRKQLGLFIDENGIIRCRGRLENSDLQYDAKNPALLPRESHITYLIICDCHEQMFHAGPHHTTSKVRERFWVTHCRTAVNEALRRCTLCRKYQGGAYRVPDPPPLPNFRVSQSRPFSHVGLDYLGPLYVKSVEGEMSKVWICLFTCAAVRAIHLEVVSSLTTEDFLLCLRRFMALYGVPDLIISDNAKHFHAASRSIQRIWADVRKNPAVRSLVATRGTEWRFITQLAPWFGGFYERLVNPVKRALKRCLDKRCVSLVELQTVTYEVAKIVNSRPLVEIDSEAGSQTLTPAHFLLRDITYVPTGKGAAKNEATAPLVVREWKRTQKLLDTYWDIWRKQYLSELRARLWSHKQRNTAAGQPRIGAVVQIADKLPRAVWRLGRISDLIVSADGKIRSTTVRLANGNEITRSIKFLHPLEFDDDSPARESIAVIHGVVDNAEKSTNK